MTYLWRVVVRWPDEAPTIGPEQPEPSARRRFASLKEENTCVWIELQRKRLHRVCGEEAPGFSRGGSYGTVWHVVDWAGVKLIDVDKT
jgi:hypothetical protein